MHDPQGLFYKTGKLWNKLKHTVEKNTTRAETGPNWAAQEQTKDGLPHIGLQEVEPWRWATHARLELGFARGRGGGQRRRATCRCSSSFPNAEAEAGDEDWGGPTAAMSWRVRPAGSSWRLSSSTRSSRRRGAIEVATRAGCRWLRRGTWGAGARRTSSGSGGWRCSKDTRRSRTVAVAPWSLGELLFIPGKEREREPL